MAISVEGLAATKDHIPDIDGAGKAIRAERAPSRLFRYEGEPLAAGFGMVELHACSGEILAREQARCFLFLMDEQLGGRSYQRYSGSRCT
ncbi:hypothetical protein [Mesorhizobium kowhaii]|uniref:hypothetical protein n=1 Tax=Mesorhizobium kowhaii TaxID=1300272 RepID=UPI0011B78779|nr:hypothetical protein [Mesorhizobium kowhaii]